MARDCGRARDPPPPTVEARDSSTSDVVIDRAPPVDKPPVDVPVTNNSSVSEPAAPGSNSDILGSDEPAALSPGSNSDILGSNGALLFRQSLKRKSSHIAQDIWGPSVCRL